MLLFDPGLPIDGKRFNAVIGQGILPGRICGILIKKFGISGDICLAELLIILTKSKNYTDDYQDQNVAYHVIPSLFFIQYKIFDRF